MSFRKEVKDMSNKELIKEIREYGCDSDYKWFWDVAMDEFERRVGTKSKEIEEAIKDFNLRIFYDIFSEEMIKIAEISIEALERMKDGL